MENNNNCSLSVHSQTGLVGECALLILFIFSLYSGVVEVRVRPEPGEKDEFKLEKLQRDVSDALCLFIHLRCHYTLHALHSIAWPGAEAFPGTVSSLSTTSQALEYRGQYLPPPNPNTSFSSFNKGRSTDESPGDHCWFCGSN